MPNVPPNVKKAIKRNVSLTPREHQWYRASKTKRKTVGKLKKRFTMSGVGFEPTPPFGDQNTRYHSDGKGISP